MTDINWNEPIEAVHTDGRVVAAKYHQYIYNFRSVSVEAWADTLLVHDDGSTPGNTGWAIRNASLRTADEALTRMERLVERIANGKVDKSQTPLSVAINTEIVQEARAIQALREPVDLDLAEAARICTASPYDLDDAPVVTNAHICRAVLAGIKRGRELAAESK